MAYLVLARKYRPKAFNEVVGQQHIIKTLINSILSGRTAHSFLFTGPRGVGKTSTARILAKSLNCRNLQQGEPCNVCEVCQSITRGNSLDIIEIDGASNNSVDDIRDLRDKVRYLPTASQYKIYIIDEVHMLSTAAFNALLKTLEEPPPHVLFIFATTEPHKIPATILSRCQRYDFKRLSVKEITNALQDLAIKEGLTIAQPILTLVARSADGSMRDALSILDQVISSSEGNINYEEVVALLGFIKKEHIASIWQAVLEAKPEPIISGMIQILERGYDLRYFTEQLLEYLRDLMVFKNCGHQPDTEGLYSSAEEIEWLAKQSNLATKEALHYYFVHLMQCFDQMRGSSHPQIMLEMALIRLAEMPKLFSLEEIIQRLSHLEQIIKTTKIPAAEEKSEKKPAKPTHEPIQSDLPKASTIPSSRPSPPKNPPSPSSPPPSPPSPPLSPPLSVIKEPLGAKVSVSLQGKWGLVIEEIKKEKKTLLPILQRTVVDSYLDDCLTITLPESPAFYYDTLKQEPHKSILQKWVRKIFGDNCRIECRVQKGLSEVNQAPSSQKKETTIPKERITTLIEQYPIIKTTMETFSAQITQSNISFRPLDESH